VLPKNHEVPAGTYYLKASHGSGMFKKIKYPLSESEAMYYQSLGYAWLNSAFGLYDGEWWYNVFPKEIFLEELIFPHKYSLSYNFHIFSGEIGYINISKKPEETSGDLFLDTRFDENFLILSHQNEKSNRVSIEFLSLSEREMLKSYAKTIGKCYPYVRVDFLIDVSGNVYLNEVTFTPSNGLESRPNDFDLYLGDLWLKQH
jgi:hypothetical protein